MLTFRLLRKVINVSQAPLQRSSKICVCQILNYCQGKLPPGYVNDNVENSLWFTTLPSKKKNAFRLARGKVPKELKEPKTGYEVITCRDKTFNHYSHDVYRKSEPVRLLSSLWTSKKRNGDYFKINATTEHPAFLLPPSEVHEVPHTFEEAGIEKELTQLLKKKHIHNPTSIQAKAIPEVLAGKNTVIAAETGCGKTLAYLLPMIQQVQMWKTMLPSRPNSPYGIVIVPSRDLAVQIGRVAESLCKDLNINTLTLLGGHTKRMFLMRPQLDDVDILIATFGVISKLMTHKIYKTHNCMHLVMDEADTLLDDSFSEQVLHFARRFKIQFAGPKSEYELPTGTQLTLVSATMPTSLEPLLKDLVCMESLEIISTKYLHRIVSHVPQMFMRVLKVDKPFELLKLIKKDVEKNRPVIIFCNRTVCCDFVFKYLHENNIVCSRLNKCMAVDDRVGKMEDFLKGRVNVLISTDIASRGLDMTRVKHVVNFDFPLYMADYIHRCGRTGRIGHDDNCRITNFISGRRELELVQKIEESARRRVQLPNVNNNITRIVQNRAEKAGDPELKKRVKRKHPPPKNSQEEADEKVNSTDDKDEEVAATNL